MDHRLRDILKSLVVNIEVLDEELVRFARSELFVPDGECLGLIEHIRDACMATLQNVQSVERKIQGSAFVIPPTVAATLE